MRKVILGLAVSLDGFIEGPNGEYDWCFTDQDYGMADFFKRIDSLFMGRKSYELALSMGDMAMPGFPKLKEYVFSNTLQNVRKDAILINGDTAGKVKTIKNEPGRDIWLFGGASLTTFMMNQGLVDELWLAVHPILLGSGKYLFSQLNHRVHLDLVDTKSFSSGLVSLTYAVANKS